MAFRDFAYPEVRQTFGLTLNEVDLFGTVQPINVREEFASRMRVRFNLPLALINEKARSEFVIAPILIEIWELLGGRFGLFSGVEFNVDSKRGLNGFCDFLLTRSPFQTEVTKPIIAVVEAKNDNVRNGLGQCVAAMVAAREFNANANPPMDGAVFGVVTTGTNWKFMRLEGTILTFDVQEYLVSELGKIMGILSHILTETNP